jgi:ribosomal protein S18 acetylase RimI-like enzyme
LILFIRALIKLIFFQVHSPSPDYKAIVYFWDMKELEVQRVQKADLLSLQEISRQTFFDTFADVNTPADMRQYLEENLSLEQLAKEWSHPATQFYMVKQHDEVLAYLKINEADAQTERREEASLEIERIYVRQADQGKGIGQFLLEFAIQITNDKKLKVIWLGVWEHNLNAIRFYQKNNFQFFGKHSFFLGQDEQTDLLMELRLD